MAYLETLDPADRATVHQALRRIGPADHYNRLLTIGARKYAAEILAGTLTREGETWSAREASAVLFELWLLAHREVEEG